MMLSFQFREEKEKENHSCKKIKTLQLTEPLTEPLTEGFL